MVRQATPAVKTSGVAALLTDKQSKNNQKIIMNTLWEDIEELATSGNISKVEHELGVNFPHLFIETVKKYNGGTPKNNIFDTQESNERVFSNLLSFNVDNSHSILSVWEDVKDRMPNGVIPFATDPGGNLICFDYRNDNEPEVIFWNHEENFEVDENDNMNYPDVDAEYKLHTMEFVAPNFFEFLSILYKKQEVEEDFSDFEML